ncbi:MAG: hypothetical protein HYR56_16480 [Acidobacteria bacterium]|nr:hypothetical protein [Acidobacteriota bacterium]MBI3421393.1 hypothetical protein [Acidobacteriota bacterium]
MPLVINSILLLSLLAQAMAWINPVAGQTRPDAQREKAVIKQQFSKSFHDLQIISQQMLRQHDDGQLTTVQLAKQSKSINRSAKTLRSLMALGELAQEPQPVEKALSTADAFDKSIRRLAKMIYDFSHSPHHQNSKVFDTAEATKVQRDLLTIIALSKVIETNAKNYSRTFAHETGKS